MYLDICAAIEGHKTSVYIGEFDSKEESDEAMKWIKNIYSQLVYEQPDYFWVDPYEYTVNEVTDGKEYSLSLLFSYVIDEETAIIKKEEYSQKVDEIVENAKEDAKQSGSSVLVTYDPEEAMANADVVCTVTWVSMGQEDEKAERVKIFRDYQINGALFAKSKEDSIFIHCLPAYRGYEVTDDVIDGPRSVIFDEAENRLHAQKAVMAAVMGKV